jgi:FtsP/CotA-like multicopper oxidase with cupredoxin domain
MHHPVQIQKDRLIRIYLVNMLEFDPLNNFHLHANMFDYYPSGTRLQPDELTDIVTTNQGERGILEFNYKYPGKFMFHAHKTEFAEKGWMGTFFVTDENESRTSNPANNSSFFYNSMNNSFVDKSPETIGGQL